MEKARVFIGMKSIEAITREIESDILNYKFDGSEIKSQIKEAKKQIKDLITQITWDNRFAEEAVNGDTIDIPKNTEHRKRIAIAKAEIAKLQDFIDYATGAKSRAETYQTIQEITKQ